ncbi:LEAF RUST 10 DISEASE-RESISTANCE LOCUS RECEPTOR-LIKE PROTEIN KINASE-like 2.2 [Triticum urartu]|uniref:Protein kinase domain-containing protein n=1 Tax=Triticum urartu TaxID=4572 RepID=A0A8R7TMS4_TRIUA|nr:LEAF RUST 10 DISEASE-RESISTANCE LOCUS RECEPTOR-LIKE PROTEIN KINASE-like 2.2 [Triticum urartu]
MALSSGILALSIIGVLVAGIVTVVATIAIYLCAKVAVQMYLQKEDKPGGHRDGAAAGSTPRVVDEAAEVEMGSMSFFIEGVQNERPVRFSSQQLRGFTQGFAHKLGSGGFGVVYRGRFPNGAPVAVKVLNSTLGRRAEEQFMAEVGTIGRTYHINLVRLYGFCFDAAVKALVYEYMENGSLDQHLFGTPAPEGRAIGFEKLHEIAVGTAKAVRYLHEECQHRIIHYDIKPENVLLGADFGLAKLCDREDTHLTITGARGTPGYAAPELWMPLPVTHKCDVYSYGMLLFEMLGRRRNLELGLHNRAESQEWYPRWVWHRFVAGEMDAVLARAMAAGDLDAMEKAARMCKVALWCVQYRPEDRPSMGNVVRMLEGEERIATPGNPFAHLAAYSAGATLSDDTTTDSYGSSAFTGR